MRSTLALLWLVLIWLVLASSLQAQSTQVDYLRDIKPVLSERCIACHGAIKQEANLRLDAFPMLLRGGNDGPVVKTGEPESSALLQRIRSPDLQVRMPPEGQPLTKTQIALFSDWIAAGSPAPMDDTPDKDPSKHWSFQRLVRPVLPDSTETDQEVNPIDVFIQDKRKRAGVTPLPSAEPGTLLRRVYLDLIGLPPSATELNEYLHNPSDEALRETVDRLLSSPQYGERWGRHWMDVWRYSDWYGRRSVPDVMNSYAMIWRWRDWIVRSLNDDKPYSRMILEMLAADEVAPDDMANLPATGYLVRSWFKWNYETWKKDLVEHTGKAFLGLTLNCCQCHDHKFDPLSQEDYFRFRAFFEPLELRHERVPGEPDPGPFEKYEYTKSYGPIKSGMIRVFDEYLNAETVMFSKGDARLRLDGKPPMKSSPPQFLASNFSIPSAVELPLTAAYPGMKAFIQAEERNRRRLELESAESELSNVKNTNASVSDTSRPSSEYEGAQNEALTLRVETARLDLMCLEKRIFADAARYPTGNLLDDRKEDATVKPILLAAIQLEKEFAVALAKYRVALANADKVKYSQLLVTLSPDEKKGRDEASKSLQATSKKLETAKKDLVAATSKLSEETIEYAPLSPKYLSTSTGRRTALANWIVNSNNPLTARVAMNHLWLRHFGQAFVESTHDFGLHGSLPTHPELLDWLACEFMDSGWSMKHIHRQIVTSRSYQLASEVPVSRANIEGVPSESFRLDPDNRLYWRFPASRMQAEVVRDSLLSIADELNTTMGGHEIDHKQGMTSHRRSIYFSHHGEEKMEFLELFDAANACDCYKRSSSVQPQQALALSNSELTTRLSRVLATKLWDGLSLSANSVEFVQAAFIHVLGRHPQERELHASTAFLEKQERLLGESPPSKSNWNANSRARENLVHVLMNHSDFVTVR